MSTNITRNKLYSKVFVLFGLWCKTHLDYLYFDNVFHNNGLDRDKYNPEKMAA